MYLKYVVLILAANCSSSLTMKAQMYALLNNLFIHKMCSMTKNMGTIGLAEVNHILKRQFCESYGRVTHEIDFHTEKKKNWLLKRN